MVESESMPSRRPSASARPNSSAYWLTRTPTPVRSTGLEMCLTPAVSVAFTPSARVTQSTTPTRAPTGGFSFCSASRPGRRVSTRMTASSDRRPAAMMLLRSAPFPHIGGPMSMMLVPPSMPPMASSSSFKPKKYLCITSVDHTIGKHQESYNLLNILEKNRSQACRTIFSSRESRISKKMNGIGARWSCDLYCCAGAIVFPCFIIRIKDMKPMSEAGKPPFVRGPKADGIHPGAITGAGSGRPVEARFSLHPQGLTVSPACARPHRRRIIALTRGRTFL